MGLDMPNASAQESRNMMSNSYFGVNDRLDNDKLNSTIPPLFFKPGFQNNLPTIKDIIEEENNLSIDKAITEEFKNRVRDNDSSRDVFDINDQNSLVWLGS